jgi:hypothetical protein
VSKDMSNHQSKKKEREEDFWDPNRLDKVFKPLGSFGPRPIGGRGLLLKHTPYHILFKKINKLFREMKILHTKTDSRMATCWSKSRSIPENATIRKEYVKCKKPNCRRKQHGPYYYAYWKDSETKKLRKKYVGRYYFTPDELKPEEVAKNMVAQLPPDIYVI